MAVAARRGVVTLPCLSCRRGGVPVTTPGQVPLCNRECGKRLAIVVARLMRLPNGEGEA